MKRLSTIQAAGLTLPCPRHPGDLTLRRNVARVTIVCAVAVAYGCMDAPTLPRGSTDYAPSARRADGAPAQPEDGQTTVQGCGSEASPCGLENLEVTAGDCTNPDWTRGDDGVCRSDRGGEGAGTGGIGGGGGGDWGGGWIPDEDPPATAPDGIDQAEYEKLNRAEKWLCVLSRYECAAVITSGHEASVWARNQTPELGDAEGDNKRDALRHAVWQALLTRLTNSDRAKAWGDAHESNSTNPLATCMDQWNNAVGRTIGRRSGNVYAGVLTAWGNGALKGAPFSC